MSAEERRLRWRSMRSLAGLLAFWLALMAGLYVLMDHLRQPRQSEVTAEGALVIPRHPDGHFRVAGTINGEPVMFLVDTGASLVAVTDGLAKRAGLPQGERATFQTANGPREGRITRADSVQLRGGLGVSNLRVGTGFAGIGDEGDALLGQNFLRHFDVEIGRSQLVLRPR
ncbi:TIGR02281 family clan AA aspartic protease [Xenophilus sp. Marseille-Q4582]|uniref:retropepsin-like aspartic protease family protein n=1 Tax=Xenophilus sp. Marseille-Q4582 TaxID=2866600 RepID=UPI001CE3C5E2|nr:retropepsin-like aspartic protease [Xenophilus sp. Marseille-Q4582]